MEYAMGFYDEDVEHGLRTPNGEVLWPPQTYRDYQFASEEQRAALPQVLHQGAVEMKLDPDQFVASFRWVSRIKMTTVVYRTVPSETPLVSSTRADVETPISTPNEGGVTTAPASREGES